MDEKQLIQLIDDHLSEHPDVEHTEVMPDGDLLVAFTDDDGSVREFYVGTDPA